MGIVYLTMYHFVSCAILQILSTTLGCRNGLLRSQADGIFYALFPPPHTFDRVFGWTIGDALLYKFSHAQGKLN